MALLLCPDCKAYGFTWTIDGEQSPLTRWGCNACGYSAWKDEAFNRVCGACGNNTEGLLQDDNRKYWWCSRCNRVVPADQQPG